MKTAKCLFILLHIVACACMTRNIPIELDVVPDWKLGYKHLGILNAALEQKHVPREYALHSIADSSLTANMVVRNWQFSWKDDEYEIVESDSFIRDHHRIGPMNCYRELNYTIHSEEDGRFIMELGKVRSPDGEVQFLVRNDGRGITTDIFNMGQVTCVSSGRSDANYGYPNSRLRSLAHGEEFSYYAFDPNTLRTLVFSNKAVREDHILKIYSRDRHEVIMHVNKDGKIIYLLSEGLKFEQCDVDVALAERL